MAGQQLVGGVIGANLPVGGFTVTGDGAFKTDVASGRVEADAVAGGIIGYNRLLAAKPTGGTLEALLPTINESTGVLTDSTAVKTADYEVTLANFQNKLNLQADIYVGGIVGANDANTKLTIQNAANGATQNALSVGGLNPSNNGAFKGGVSLNALADGRYDFDTRARRTGGRYHRLCHTQHEAGKLHKLRHSGSQVRRGRLCGLERGHDHRRQHGGVPRQP